MKKDTYTAKEVESLCRKAFMNGGKSSYNMNKGRGFQTTDMWAHDNLKQ